MGTERTRTPHPAELRERAVRMVREHEGEHASRSAAVRLRWPARWAATARRCGGASALRQAERDEGVRAGPTSEKARIRELERENRELRQADEILRKASACFAMAELDRRPKT